MDYNSYIKGLEKTEHLYLMRSKVKRIELKNLDRFINRKKIVFDKYNIINGDKKSGKTFLINLIFDAYSHGETMLERFLPETSEFRDTAVKVVYNSISEWKYTFPKKSDYDFIEDPWIDDIDDRWLWEHKDICFLFDEPDILNNKKERDGFLNYLKGIDAQIIITSELDKDINYPNEFKIIKI
ncbi:hypothetical protein ACFL1L_04955 [Thermoplasmatota archaeon]